MTWEERTYNRKKSVSSNGVGKPEQLTFNEYGLSRIFTLLFSLDIHVVIRTLPFYVTENQLK